MTTGGYAERDLVKMVVLVSDDAGVTWYPRGGNAAAAVPLSQYDGVAFCESADAGTTWTAKP